MELKPEEIRRLKAIMAAQFATDDDRKFMAGFSAASLVRAGCSAASLVIKIPVIEKPYTRLLADIREKQRCFAQNTFGPLKDFDPKTNVCKTPMCTAGHLVNMAGAEGYALLKSCNNDFSFAAGLIHNASCPGVPPQNFNMTSNELALAYIEQRAAEEAAA